MNDQASLLDPALQTAKTVAAGYFAALDAATPAEVERVMARTVTPDFTWHGYFPFERITEAREVATTFWAPLKTALTRLQRREDIFFAGRNQIDGFQSVWVVSMGHLMGLFDAPWLGIRPTRKLTMLRYCAFVRVEGDRIAEEAMYFDIPHLMMQAGQNPFPPQTGASLVQPGPRTHDGRLLAAQPKGDGEATLALINRMLSDLGGWDLGLPLTEELARTWSDDMIWWGPAGIGATYTIERYAEQHSGPFRAAFTERARTCHMARLAEGHYGGFFGWPNFTARPTGGFMGMPATDKIGEFRVIDIYRRDGDKLAENWIFIDILYFWKQQGVDILDRAVHIGL